MDDKITIIEGPPPTFESTNEGWTFGLHDSPNLANIAITRLRTFNGLALLERCHRAWHHQQPMHLEFRAPDGLILNAPIVAARNVETDEGDMLLLWVRLSEEMAKLKLGHDDNPDDGMGN